ncbi:ethanolamine utilization protein EutN [bacterium]|nr:MAG: ethanolamine utilization protein EutN [bacterium]
MRRAKVVGKLWLSRSLPQIDGFKILILRDTSTGKEDYYLGVDVVDAGVGDEVFTVSGSASRQSEHTKNSIADTTIIAIIDPQQ